MKRAIFSVMALAAMSVAGAQTVKNLVVTDLEGKSTMFEADKVEAVLFQEAPEYRDLTTLLRTSYEETGDGFANYLIEMGTSEPDADGLPLELQDLQVTLLMKGPRSQNLKEPVLPAGYYKLGTGKDEYTFDVRLSAILVRVEEGPEGTTPMMIMDGTVDVRMDEDGEYDIRMELTTMGGSAELRYIGELPFPPGVSDFGDFTEPVNLTFTHGQGRFYGNWYYPFAADLTAQFVVGTIDNGVLIDGYVLDLPLYEPIPSDCMAPNQRIADGVYTVETRQAIAYTYIPYRFTPGKMVDFFGQTVLTGANLSYISSTGQRKQGMITGGTITVSDNGSKFVFDLLTSEEVSVKGTYTGTPYIVNYCDNDEKAPARPYSLLTENEVLDFDPNTVCIMYNEGPSIIDDANTVMVMFTVPKMDTGDYVSIDLFIDGNDLPDGTFTIDSTLAAGHGIPGAIDFGNQMLFCWYGDLGLVDSEGYNTKIGPIASGTVTISTVADGQRKFVFDVKDDAGNAITGEYTGSVIDATNVNAPEHKLIKKAERKFRKIADRRRK